MHPVKQRNLVAKATHAIEREKLKSMASRINQVQAHLRTGPGYANLAHRFNIDLYQEGFVYYRSTLLYYERLDGLDIGALMRELETPADITQIGQ